MKMKTKNATLIKIMKGVITVRSTSKMRIAKIVDDAKKIEKRSRSITCCLGFPL
jgi:hypothetical protein